MTSEPPTEFGNRKPVKTVAITPPQPLKRSGKVALLLTGTIAIGLGAYAAMPRDTCERPPNEPQPSLQQRDTDCPPRSSSSSGSHGGSGSSRSSYYSSDSSSGHSSSGSSSGSEGGGVTRGGFGSFAHGFFGGG
jgi:hypothetical protein